MCGIFFINSFFSSILPDFDTFILYQIEILNSPIGRIDISYLPA